MSEGPNVEKPRVRRDWVIIPTPSFTAPRIVSFRPRAWPSPTGAKSSIRSAASTNDLTPARTWN